MFPSNELSTTSVSAAFNTPVRRNPLRDYEWGGVDIQDVSLGLLYKVWVSEYDGTNISITNGEVHRTLLSVSDVDHISFAFDQNMQPCVAYTSLGSTKFWYFDNIASQYITLDYGAGPEYPQVSLDGNRKDQLGSSDVILSYILNDKLYYRLQRERYLQEHFLLDTPNMKLMQIGMAKNLRFRWRYVHKIKGE